ncbi:HPr kinase/phosphorylase [candidate division FCPU426 bacterium]|nr:HPr kinase/phosphorylase [candidate division FCPU426 bacterium]
MINLFVEELYIEQKDKLTLELISGREGLSRKITVPDINRPGLALAGYFDYFAFERIQVLGRTELSFLQGLGKDHVRSIFRKLMEWDVCCVIITQGLEPPEELLLAVEEKNVPVFTSQMPTTKLIAELTIYLEDKLAPETSLHGTLVDVYGIGVLILGKSGIGKSECALDLVERGHRLVADDLVDIKRTAERILMGSGPELIRHHMEIRGLGIINIKNLFGIGAIRDRKRVELVTTIEEWDEKKEYDRLGLDELTYSILGIDLPRIIIPVRPGRNLSIIIEVAAMNQRLKKSGHHTAREFNKTLISWMQND